MNTGDSMSAEELALQLGKGSFPEWLTYQGMPIIDIPFNFLLQNDQAFQVFWVWRLEDEVRLFQRILVEADFLDQPVQDFFNVSDAHRVSVPDTRTVREWVVGRIASTQQKLQFLIS